MSPETVDSSETGSLADQVLDRFAWQCPFSEISVVRHMWPTDRVLHNDRDWLAHRWYVPDWRVRTDGGDRLIIARLKDLPAVCDAVRDLGLSMSIWAGRTDPKEGGEIAIVTLRWEEI